MSNETTVAAFDAAPPRTARRAQPAEATVRPLEAAAVALALLALTVAWQLRAGAYASEFVDDDASHYITGLLAHDFLTGGWRQSPLAFLKDFAAHYPGVGIGHWPPGFYALESVWMLLFSTSRASVLFLSAAMASAMGLIGYVFTTKWLGRSAGLFVALVFVASPIVRRSSAGLMIDVSTGLFCVLAMLAFVRYLDTEKSRFSVLFGVWAAIALMVKGNAGCLALFPPLALLLARRFDLLRKPSFWAAVPVVALLAGPWYVGTYGMVAAGFKFAWGWDYVAAALRENWSYLLEATGPLAAALGLGGLLLAMRGGGARQAERNKAACAAALVLSVWLFQCVVPSGIQDRYLIPLLPPFLMLAAWAMLGLADLALRRGGAGPAARRAMPALGLLAIAVPVLASAPDPMLKPHYGLIGAARAAWSRVTEQNPSVLIVAQAQAEMAAVAELAMRDPARPSLFAVRGSRLLGYRGLPGLSAALRLGGGGDGGDRRIRHSPGPRSRERRGGRVGASRPDPRRDRAIPGSLGARVARRRRPPFRLALPRARQRGAGRRRGEARRPLRTTSVGQVAHRHGPDHAFAA